MPLLTALRCCAVMAAVSLPPSPFAAAGSVTGDLSSSGRHRRQLQNSYLGLGSHVEILPVGDTSGVSSSYSLVETSKIPASARREPYHAAAAHRNQPAYRNQGAATAAVDYRTSHGGGGKSQSYGSSSGRVRFPEEQRRRTAGQEADDSFDDVEEEQPKRKKAKKPATSAAKGGSDAETFGESKATPKNIKDIVEERPAESKLSGDFD